ncbi:PREDICTED: barrier-to-autointegration factor isoform X1 [Gavialis gangeticus]|nr:PREDICTED: barrier-to-autointegration factor isoform X1 [Gavialis gangeticus]
MGRGRPSTSRKWRGAQAQWALGWAGAAVGTGAAEVECGRGTWKMSSTSQKHRDFVAEPMGEKPVGSLAGIGEVLGKKLAEKGFDKAYVVLGQFLVLRKDEELFREWLKDTCGANAKQSRDCSGCLREWCDAFL